MTGFFTNRYLTAKKTVDDRALNSRVWRAFWELCPPSSRIRPLELLELGAGNGAMIERILDSHMLTTADYTALDSDADHIAQLQARAATWAGRHPYFRVMPVEEAIDPFVAEHSGRRLWDVLIAHAFLDLFHLPTILPGLFSLLPPGGVFYFSLNFDGGTTFEPVIDRPFDELLERLYHESMDLMLPNGPRSGSRAGRQLIAAVEAAGGEIAAAGSSDWVVFPQQGVYPADEAYFLYHILHFFERSLAGHPEINPDAFAAWLQTRRRQIEDGQLVFIARHLDLTGKIP